MKNISIVFTKNLSILLQYCHNIHQIFHKMKEIDKNSLNIAAILLQNSSNFSINEGNRQKLCQYCCNIPRMFFTKKLAILLQYCFAKIFECQTNFLIFFGHTTFKQYCSNILAILINIAATFINFAAILRQYCLNIRCYYFG